MISQPVKGPKRFSRKWHKTLKNPAYFEGAE